nr:uncharacterized protein LOC129447733 isoform X2 [Misgurnus anguillicaudatus]XP_055065481.1 uncharacterized protein LOC129447733 isoform X2 [Misgurnus anguillicaudatus]
MWQCKHCPTRESTRYKLLKHYKLHHHYARGQQYQCIYVNCPCTFRTWTGLHTHVYKAHSSQPTQTALNSVTFKCEVCECSDLSTERDFFVHIGTHLHSCETVGCVFLGCSFQTNIYSTFYTHKKRKHHPHTLKDFKTSVVQFVNRAQVSEASDIAGASCTTDVSFDEVEAETVTECDSEAVENLPEVIERKIAAILLKLEHIFHIPAKGLDELLEELHFLSLASEPVAKCAIADIFKKHNLNIGQAVVEELANSVCVSHPVTKSFEKCGPLATSYKRKQYYKVHFRVVEPVEYFLSVEQKRSFQYVPLLQLLQEILSHNKLLDKVIEEHIAQESREALHGDQQVYRSFRDGENYKRNGFLAVEKLRISIKLYIDEFEVCNPLGTSRKKHKLCGVYWVLDNFPPGSHSALSSIYLAVLCKSDDLRKFGFQEVLNPLLKDLVILEEHGVFISQLNECIKGTVSCVVADNLGAHGLAGFVESFSGEYFCRFCTAKKTEIQLMTASRFELRTRELHDAHLKCALEKESACCGVKRDCVLSKNLSHFHVTAGYPPDLAHDLFEGIIPVELAYCFSLLISKKYFSLEKLNNLIQTFEYKWADKTNKPHTIPQTFSVKKSIGGNAHENWALLRLLPLIIGPLLPEDEPAWHVVLDLKDIVELVVAPVHTAESISYLECKIDEHRQRYQELFPNNSLLPKHHFLEHYAVLIQRFGPLVHTWTLRFEAKHSVLKQIARHTNCFKNIPLTLARKHQLVIASDLHSVDHRTPVAVTHVSSIPVDVLQSDVAAAIKQRLPHENNVQITNCVSYNGMNYNKGMILVHGQLFGLPELAEILQICILQGQIHFIVKKFSSWYREHFRAFELDTLHVKEVALIGHGELLDDYPLAAYSVGGLRLVSLKRHINLHRKLD